MSGLELRSAGPLSDEELAALFTASYEGYVVPIARRRRRGAVPDGDLRPRSRRLPHRRPRRDADRPRQPRPPGQRRLDRRGRASSRRAAHGSGAGVDGGGPRGGAGVRRRARLARGDRRERRGGRGSTRTSATSTFGTLRSGRSPARPAARRSRRSTPPRRMPGSASVAPSGSRGSATTTRSPTCATSEGWQPRAPRRSCGSPADGSASSSSSATRDRSVSSSRGPARSASPLARAQPPRRAPGGAALECLGGRVDVTPARDGVAALGVSAGTRSSTLEADPSATNPSRLWDASQKGFVRECPQRQRTIASPAGRSSSRPSASTILTSPTTLYGPFARTVIVTSLTRRA